MSKKDKKKKQKEERLQPELQARHPPTMIRLKYDAAQTTPENARHWAMADGLSADGSMTPEIRRTLRNRARLEVANNAYARGMILTLADVCIGTGPRLQMLSDDEDFNSIIEEEFVAWAEAIRLAERLKTLRMSKIADGESFCALLKNPKVRHPVEIDLRPVETDRVTSPYPTVTNEVDGVEYDSFGNPVQYHVSSEHPGDGSIWHGTFSAIPSEFMLHWYRSDRPGQSRGLPEIMPALPLFAQLRRYTLAVLAAAETAADFAAVMYTDSPAQGDEAEAPTPYDLVPLEKRMLTVMPDGWKIGQIRAEQPTTPTQNSNEKFWAKSDVVCKSRSTFCWATPRNTITLPVDLITNRFSNRSRSNRPLANKFFFFRFSMSGIGKRFVSVCLLLRKTLFLFIVPSPNGSGLPRRAEARTAIQRHVGFGMGWSMLIRSRKRRHPLRESTQEHRTSQLNVPNKVLTGKTF